MDISAQDEYLARDQSQTPTGHSGHHKGALGAGVEPGAAHGHIAGDTACRWDLRSPRRLHPPPRARVAELQERPAACAAGIEPAEVGSSLAARLERDQRCSRRIGQELHYLSYRE